MRIRAAPRSPQKAAKCCARDAPVMHGRRCRCQQRQLLPPTGCLPPGIWVGCRCCKAMPGRAKASAATSFWNSSGGATASRPRQSGAPPSRGAGSPALRGDLRAKAELVPQPSDVGPGGAGAAGVLGGVLDYTDEELELAAELRDGSGRSRRQTFQALERLVEPTSQVFLEVAASEHRLFAGVKSMSSFGTVEGKRRDLSFE
jgi:hypothetical protein